MRTYIAVLVMTTIVVVNTTIVAQSQFGFNTETPHASAVLEIVDTNRGLIIPRMTTTHRTSIASPAGGLLVYDSTTTSFWYYVSPSWVELVYGNVNNLSDQDGNTKIQVEETGDDDVIRFDIAGTEFFRMNNGRLEVLNTGGSIFIGDSSGANDDLTSNKNIFIGYHAGKNSTTGFNSHAAGYQALYSNTTGASNIAIGYNAVYTNTTGSSNVGIGDRSLYSNTTGPSNTAIGYQALYSNTTGWDNTATGYRSLYSNTTAGANTAHGYLALYTNSTGANNTTSGFMSLHLNTTGYKNTSNGARALFSNTTGYQNTAIGFKAHYSNTTGYDNTIIGDSTGYENTTGFRNTYIGKQAGGLATANNSVAIGYNAKVGGSNEYVLGDSAKFMIKNGSVGIGTNSPNELLEIRGSSANLEISNEAETESGIIFSDAQNSSESFSILFNATTANHLKIYDSNDLQARIRQDNSAQNDDGWATQTIDYGEFMEKLNPEEDIEIYEVVAIKNNKITKNTTGSNFIMVTATDAGIRGGNPLIADYSRDDDPNWLVVAYIGQIPLLVEGEVHEGDYMIPSGANDGKAMAISSAAITRELFNQVIGRALESSENPVYNSLETFQDPNDAEQDSEMLMEMRKMQDRRGTANIINVAVGLHNGIPGFFEEEQTEMKKVQSSIQQLEAELEELRSLKVEVSELKGLLIELIGVN
ncbi:MAG: hypothetical protein IH946_08110 [Bacteroidetes bacterium]|nr:hypothetical protein [Bacteroidota bacterium]